MTVGSVDSLHSLLVAMAGAHPAAGVAGEHAGEPWQASRSDRTVVSPLVPTRTAVLDAASTSVTSEPEYSKRTGPLITFRLTVLAVRHRLSASAAPVFCPAMILQIPSARRQTSSEGPQPSDGRRGRRTAGGHP